MEGVGVALAGELAEGGFFDGKGEGESEAGFGEFELLHVERCLFRPHDLLQAKGAIPFAVPAAIRFADDERAIRQRGQCERGALQAVDEGKAGPLILAADFFEEDAVHAAEHEFAHEELFLKGTEFATAAVANDAGAALAHFHIRQPHGRRAVAGHFFHRLGHSDAIGLLRLDFDWRIRAHGIRDGVGVAEVSAFLRVEDGRGWHPVALLVTDKDIALEIRADAAGTAKSGAPWLQFALRRGSHDPAAPERIALHHGFAHAAIQRGEDAAFSIKNRAIGILVVSAAHAPTCGGGEVFIGGAVAIGIADLRDLRTLRGVKRSIMKREPEDLMQAAREELKALFALDPDFTFAQPHGQFAIWHDREAAGFEIHACGQVVGLDAVVIVRQQRSAEALKTEN